MNARFLLTLILGFLTTVFLLMALMTHEVMNSQILAALAVISGACAIKLLEPKKKSIDEKH